MPNATSLKTFLNKGTVQMPVIIPFSAMAGYSICGTKCAGIGVLSSTFDLTLKYFKLSDSYYTTFSILGGVTGHKMAAPFVDKYNILIATCDKPTMETDAQAAISVSTLKVEYLAKILAVGMGAIGILTSNMISKFENWILNNDLTAYKNCAVKDTCPELVTHDHHDNPEL
jgi:hypothetical protein